MKISSISILWLFLIVPLSTLGLANRSWAASALVDPGPVVSKIEQLGDIKLTGLKSIIQDRSGFLWLASNEGLMRFDGQAVKRFVHSEDVNSLASNDIRGIVEDPDGILWLITRGGGLSRFDPQTEHFTNFHADPNNPKSLDSDQLNSISLGQDNRLWIGSNHGINRFDRKSFENTRLNSALAPASMAIMENIQPIFEDSQQRLWFSVRRKGLSLFTPSNGQIRRFEHDPSNPHSLDANMVSEIYETANGTIWIGTAASINRFDADKMQMDRYAIPLKESNKVDHASVTRIFEDLAGDLWVGTFYNGVSRLKVGDQQLSEVNNGTALENSLNALHINDIFQDNSGTLWFVTPRSGLIKLKSSDLLFEHRLLRDKDAIKLTAIASDGKANIWLASNRGLYSSEPATSNSDNSPISAWNNNLGEVTAIAQSKALGLVVNSTQSGLMVIKSPDMAEPLLGSEALTGTFQCMTIDEQDRLFVGFNNGLYQYDNKTAQFKTLDANLAVTSIAVQEQQLVIATKNGQLWRLDLTNGEKLEIASDFSVNQLLSDKKPIWVATSAQGLWQLNPPYSDIQPISSLPLKTISSISTDLNGELWLTGTEADIWHYSPSSEEYQRYDEQQGLRLNNYGIAMSSRSPKGEIIFANAQGFVRFKPQDLLSKAPDNIENSTILLSDFKLFNQPVALHGIDPTSPLQTTIDNTQQLTLSYQQNWFSVAFASSNHQHPENLRYSYKMEGLSEQWIDTDASNRTASFTSVAPGKYVLMFRISDPQSGWQSKPRQLIVNITPPWWATKLAYLTYFVGALCLVFLFNFVRTRQLRRRAALLEQGIAVRTEELSQRADTIARLLEEKDRLIANISHEFRTPLTLILGPLGSQLNKTQDPDSQALLTLAQTNGQRLLAMVDQLLDLAKLQDQRPETSQPKPLVQTCGFILDSFRGLAQLHNIQLHLDHQLEDEICLQMQPDALEKILSNLLSNAIKYGGDNQEITVNLTLSDEFIQLSIRDHGPGISPADQALIFERFARLKQETRYIPGAGIGLALVKDLVTQHNGTISIDSELGQGCNFIIKLPLPLENRQLQQPQTSVNRQIADDAVAQVAFSQRTDLGIAQADEDESKTSILVIEDNQDMRHYLVSCLQDHYNCLQAADGEQGSQLAMQKMPDLVISDVSMPKMDGFAVTRLIKTSPATNHIPVILLTARGDSKSRLRGWSERADEYLEKPFSEVELLARIENLLALRLLLRQKYQLQFSQHNTSLPSPLPPSQENVQNVIPETDKTANTTHQAFLDQVNQVLSANFADESFDVAQFAADMALSHRQFGRKMKHLLDMTPVEALRHFRLQKAAEMLLQGITPSVAAHKSGFSTHSHFSQCFKAYYQCNPSAYVGKVNADADEF